MCQHIIWQAQKKTVLEMFCADRTASSARKLVLPVAERSEILSTYKDKRILVVEDAYFLSDEVRQKLVSLGALVVGPVATVTDAMDLIDGSEIDAAILDVHLALQLHKSVYSESIGLHDSEVMDGKCINRDNA